MDGASAFPLEQGVGDMTGTKASGADAQAYVAPGEIFGIMYLRMRMKKKQNNDR